VKKIQNETWSEICLRYELFIHQSTFMNHKSLKSMHNKITDF